MVSELKRFLITAVLLVAVGGLMAAAQYATARISNPANTAAFLEEIDIDTESELETILTNVSNVFTNNDNIPNANVIDSLSVIGGLIDNTPIGTSTPSTGAFTLSTTTSATSTDNYVSLKQSIASSTSQTRTLTVGGPITSNECDLSDGATVTFDLRSCNQGRVTLADNRTIDFTNQNEAAGQPIRFVVCQDGTGSRTLTWDAAVKWAGGTAPTLTTTAGRCDVFAGFTTRATSTPFIFLDKVLSF